MINKTDFAERLSLLRSKCGLSQGRLADMLFISGQAVSKWENGNSLPDVELLVPLAQILGVSVDYLLSGEQDGEKEGFINNNMVISENIASYDIPDEGVAVLAAMSSVLPREYLYKAARYLEKEMFEYNITAELISTAGTGIRIGGEKTLYSQTVPLKPEILAPLSKQLSSLTIRAINRGYNPVLDILDILKCPVCGGEMEYLRDSDGEYLSCGNSTHRFYINDGVVDFKTLEVPGFTWSSWIRCYDDYKRQWGAVIESKAKNSADLDEEDSEEDSELDFVNELRKAKPPIILDIGTGNASSIRKLMKFIDWDCIIILTDLSHRILKYDKRYIDDNPVNPRIKLVCLACDVRNLPLADNSIPCVLSNGGFDSVLYDFDKSFLESVRVLTEEGSALFTLGLVEDRCAEGTAKWLDIIKREADGDIMSSYYNQIFDVREWSDKLQKFGFRKFDITVKSRELPPPDGDTFPYDCMISRWMAMAFVAAGKCGQRSNLL